MRPAILLGKALLSREVVHQIDCVAIDSTIVQKRQFKLVYLCVTTILISPCTLNPKLAKVLSEYDLGQKY